MKYHIPICAKIGKTRVTKEYTIETSSKHYAKELATKKILFEFAEHLRARPHLMHLNHLKPIIYFNGEEDIPVDVSSLPEEVEA